MSPDSIEFVRDIGSWEVFEARYDGPEYLVRGWLESEYDGYLHRVPGVGRVDGADPGRDAVRAATEKAIGHAIEQYCAVTDDWRPSAAFPL